MFRKFLILAVCICFFPTLAYAFDTSAEGYVLINGRTRQVIYADNERARKGMASTTKIMTCLVALENGNTTDIFTVSENAQNQEGSSIYLKSGEKISLSELLYGLMLNSGNDAAVAIAEGIGGDTDTFVNMMNEKAAELGCRDTHFANPSGLPDENHYSTAYDMAIITAYAMENDEFKKIAATKEHVIELTSSKTYLKNHNRLLWQYDYCTGGKTGYTKSTGRCFVSCAKKDGKETIAVTFNDRDDWNDHMRLHEMGLEKIDNVPVLEENELLCTKIIRGRRVNILSCDKLELPLFGGKRDVLCKIFIDENINEKIDFGTVLGHGEIFVGNFNIASIKIKSGTSVKESLKEAFCDNVMRNLNMALFK